MGVSKEKSQEVKRQALVIHNYVFKNSGQGVTAISEALCMPASHVHMRLKDLVDKGKVKNIGYAGRGGTGRLFESTVDPEVILPLAEVTAMKKKESIPASLILSKLWTPDHLKLSA